jgi:hypothetical protein
LAGPLAHNQNRRVPTPVAHCPTLEIWNNGTVRQLLAFAIQTDVKSRRASA